MDYRIVEGLDNMELSDIVHLLRTTYWAGDRPEEVIETALRNSHCYGICLPGSNRLAAFARVVSDGATMYYLADVVVDTTDYPLARLRQRLVEEFSRDSARSGMDLHVRSFGYKYGIPEDADLVLDVRFLPNPFYVPELKEHTGLESPVRDYVLSFAVTGTFLDKVMDMLRFLIPGYREEGKPSLMICVGMGFTQLSFK